MTAEEALRSIAAKQAEVLKTIETNGFVFDDIGSEPGNWKHLAFTLYTEICEIDTIARHGLGIEVGDPLPAEAWPEPKGTVGRLPEDYWESAE